MIKLQIIKLKVYWRFYKLKRKYKRAAVINKFKELRAYAIFWLDFIRRMWLMKKEIKFWEKQLENHFPATASGDSLERIAIMYGIDRNGMSDNELREKIKEQIDKSTY